ncbi:PAS domain S-box protein [candidate division KSB1 bacterium]|nr:PAS domain S-box protein [candidate division KSB1 bacterium]
MNVDDNKGKGEQFHQKNEKSLHDIENYIFDHIYKSGRSLSLNSTTADRDNKKMILLIDDDPDMIEVGRKIIISAGYNFLSAKDGLEGIDFILKYKPDLILLDYMMPGIDGVEVFQRLVTNQRFRHLSDTPVIMLTAKNDYELDRGSLFEMGLSAFLIKPFGHRELINVIDNVFILNQVKKKNKELEQKIKRSEYKYQDLIENANDIIFTLNLKGDFMILNRRLTTLTGFSREDWMGRSFFDLVAPEDRVDARINFQKAIQGKARIFECRIICQNGFPLFLSMNINPIFERAEVVGLVGIARDITQRKELEQENIELKNFNESIIQSIYAGLITLDLDRKITSFNSGAEDVLGYKSEEVIGKNIDDVIPKEESKRLVPEIIPPDHSNIRRELETTRKNGSKVTIGYTLTPRIDNYGLKVGHIISFRDISQIKQMQSEVLRMDRLASLGVLASGLAHEVRNPIAGIKIIAQTLEEDFEVNDTRREYLGRIIAQVNRLDELLRTLFSYAKPREPNLKKYQLETIIKEVLILIEDRIKKSGIEFETKLSESLPSVFVDFHQIQQIFINLFINAIEAMESGGKLIVEAAPIETQLQPKDRRNARFAVTKKSEYIRVKVIDNGKGIDQEAVNRIFDPFFTTKATGTGLGLSIVYRIVEDHKGDISVESESGKGTTFTILLPTEE